MSESLRKTLARRSEYALKWLLDHPAAEVEHITCTIVGDPPEEATNWKLAVLYGYQLGRYDLIAEEEEPDLLEEVTLRVTYLWLVHGLSTRMFYSHQTAKAIVAGLTEGVPE